MAEISIILRDPVHITINEFRALDKYALCGSIFTVIHKPGSPPTTIRFKGLEYIFDSEALLLYKLSFDNIFVQWETKHTKKLAFCQEYKIQESIYIKPYCK